MVGWRICVCAREQYQHHMGRLFTIASIITAADKRAITQELHNNCIAVHLTSQQISDFYEGFSNSTLWPLFHYFPQHSVHSDRYWNEYRKVNHVFMRTIVKTAQPEATIWIHDYHLMMLPKLLRSSLPGSAIGFFLHIPFPSYEIFRQLPQRKDILNGLLGADLVGFHIYDYAVHFTHSVERLLGFEHNLGTVILKDRLVHTDAFPIGINYNRYANANKLPEVKAEISRLRKHFKNKQIILSMDRLDYSKGILSRLEVFDAFLERNPHYHNKVVLTVVAIPSRTEIEAYQSLRDQVEQAVSRINGKYGTVDWTPVSYQYKNLPFEQIAALYNEAKVALVTPMRDGMNLVAKEFIATKGRQAGVLVISEMAGAVDELPEATRVNPNDKAAMVKALERAITMPLVQQRRRLHIMQSRIAKYNVARWAEDLGMAAAATRRQQTWPAKSSQLMTDFRAAKNRLILLDYDGTLAEFVSTHDPALVKPTPQRRAMLSRLSTPDSITAVVISGRPKEALEGWFGNSPLQLVAEHGAWTRQADGTWQACPDLDTGWKKRVMPILANAGERTPGSAVEEKDYALVWHFRNVTPDLAYVRATKLKHDIQAALKDNNVEVYDGHKVIEVKHRSITKGAAAANLLKNGNYDFVMAIGDDYTDEHMFSVLPDNAYTIKVGHGETKARYSLPSVDAVIKLLTELAKIANKP
jgi:trehalose 6-phosphate synthase/phosphatase